MFVYRYLHLYSPFNVRLYKAQGLTMPYKTNLRSSLLPHSSLGYQKGLA